MQYNFVTTSTTATTTTTSIVLEMILGGLFVSPWWVQGIASLCSWSTCRQGSLKGLLLVIDQCEMEEMLHALGISGFSKKKPGYHILKRKEIRVKRKEQQPGLKHIDRYLEVLKLILQRKYWN